MGLSDFRAKTLTKSGLLQSQGCLHCVRLISANPIVPVVPGGSWSFCAVGSQPVQKFFLFFVVHCAVAQGHGFVVVYVRICHFLPVFLLPKSLK